MLNTYLVTITAEIPYPWSKYYFEKAASEGPAMSRAVKKYRQDVKSRFGKARRIREFSMKVSRIRENTIVVSEP